MLYVSVFNAKENISRDIINLERKEWIDKGFNERFKLRCKSFKRYEVLGISPLKIFFVIDTDDHGAINLLSTHFGDAWNSITYPVIDREIEDALEEDHAVIGG